MKLCIARHGHKADQVPGNDVGFNTPLSDIGFEQAEVLAAFLAEEEGIEYLYSSCQLRSLQTAEPLADRLSEPWHVWPVFYEGTRRDWQERFEAQPDDAAWATAWRAGEALNSPSKAEMADKHGEYYLLSDIPELFPGAELSQPFPFPDAWWKPKRGNSAPLGYARAEFGLNALLQRHDPGDHVAIICHGTIGDMLVTVLKDFARQRRHFSCDTAGVHRLDRQEGDHWRIEYINNNRYLPADLRV